MGLASITVFFCVKYIIVPFLFLLFYILSCFLLLRNYYLLLMPMEIAVILIHNFGFVPTYFELFIKTLLWNSSMFSSPLFCAVIIQIKSLYTLYIHQYRFKMIVICPFKSGEKSYNQKFHTVFYIYLCNYLYLCFLFLHIDSQMLLCCGFDFSLKVF